MSAAEEVFEYVDLPFTLHDYQTEDVNAACSVDCFGSYLDPGLGKTAEATVIGIYKLLHGFNSVMTLVPASLITQWITFLNSLGLEVCDYRGTPKKRAKISLDADFIVMSPQVYQKDYDRLKELKDLYFIIDEATVMCNNQNVLYKMLRGGVRKVETFLLLKSGVKMPVKKNISYDRLMTSCVLLTGTPINSPLDAYGLISITSPDAYVNRESFYRQHVTEENNFGAPVSFTDLDKINKYLTENAVRREVGDHLNLPDKIYRVIKYDLSNAHMKLYKKLVDEQILVLKDGSILDATDANAMYHMCQKFIFSPVEFTGKIEGLETLDTVITDTRQRLIFNNYRASNKLMMERYNAGGCYGEVSRKNQEIFVREFQEGKIDTLVANPKSGGVGLNLQCCDQVVFPELPITSRDFRQSEARAWRQGQKNTVVLTILVARKTIQTTLLRRVMKKDDLSMKTLHSKSSLRKDLLGE